MLELLEGGELLQVLARMTKFSEGQAASIMRQLVSAVSHMHSNNVVHRDLKPEVGILCFSSFTQRISLFQNILFESASPDATLRLVDFGFARLLPTSKDSLVTPYCGTLHYAAPEVSLRVFADTCISDRLGFPRYSR